MPIWAQESLNRTLFERIVNGNLCLGTICSGAGPAMSIRFEPAWPGHVPRIVQHSWQCEAWAVAVRWQMGQRANALNTRAQLRVPL